MFFHKQFLLLNYSISGWKTTLCFLCHMIHWITDNYTSKQATFIMLLMKVSFFFSIQKNFITSIVNRPGLCCPPDRIMQSKSLMSFIIGMIKTFAEVKMTDNTFHDTRLNLTDWIECNIFMLVLHTLSLEPSPVLGRRT